jgi:hypothetical protein
MGGGLTKELAKLFLVIGLVGVHLAGAVDEEFDSPADELDSLREELKSTADEITSLQQRIEGEIEKGRTHLGATTDLPALCQGRLTLVSNTAITTTDQVGATTLYFTPYTGSTISFYQSSVWTVYNFSQLSLTLSGMTAGKNYDIFVYNNAGTITMVLGTAWSSNTARATALTLQDGVYVNSANTAQKYVGTIRATAATTTEDSAAQRFVWNYFNRQRRFLFITDQLNTSWTYASATWRAANNNTADQVRFVIGINDVLVFGRVQNAAGASSGTGLPAANGIGLDSTTVNVATIYGANVCITGTYSYSHLNSDYAGYPGIGYHYLQWLETANTSTTTTFVTTNGNAFQAAGMFGEVEG